MGSKDGVNVFRYFKAKEVRLRGSKVLYRQGYTPLWVWIVAILILWNSFMVSWFIPYVLVDILLLVVSLIAIFVIIYYFSKLYVVTNKEISVIRKYGKVEKSVEITSSLFFKVLTSGRARNPPREGVGDIVVYDSNGDEVLILKRIHNPVRLVKILNGLREREKFS